MNKKTIVFEQIIRDYENTEQGSTLLVELINRNEETHKDIPIRYRILALGFVAKMTPEEVDEKLLEAGCPQLYARSFWEASLIYAYKKHLSFEEWRKLEKQCSMVYDKIESEFFKDNSITINELKRYLEANSTPEKNNYVTLHQTRMIESAISKIDEDEEFYNYINRIVHIFSVAREKTRFYFCKYLYFYLDGMIEKYIEKTGNNIGTEDDMEDIIMIKGLTKLKRKRFTAEEKRELLNNQAISPKQIFDAFNYFFFEYVSQDWLEILLEYYGNIEKLPDGQKSQLAQALRHYDKSLEGKSDDEVIAVQIQKIQEEDEELDKIYSREGTNRGYQKNRGGENIIRKIIKGNVDIDRTSLVCFLIFFGSNTRLSEKNQINVRRLSNILLECGFEPLNPRNEFDKFIMEYLESGNPEDFLMEEVTKYAIQEKNFFLYKMYRGAVSYDEEFKKIVG